MLNWIARIRTVWSLNCVYLQNVFTNHVSNTCLKTEFGVHFVCLGFLGIPTFVGYLMPDLALNYGWYAIKPSQTKRW